jgi:ABC transporter (permease subunit)
LMDRFRSMPIGRSPIIIGRTVAELVRALFAIVAMVVISLIVGFRFHGTFLDALIALAVLLAFAFSMSWLAAFIGLMAPGPEAAQGLGTIWLYPFSFISSAFVPTDTMPDWLRWFADYSPMTTTVNATRALVNGVDPGSSIWVTLIWCSGALAVSVPLAIRAFGSEK